MSDYSPRALMVAAAARQIADGDVVFTGMRLPLLGFALAKTTHAPSAVGLFENGLIRETPATGFVVTMGDTPNQRQATAATTLRMTVPTVAPDSTPRALRMSLRSWRRLS